jgi:hypothetical protein
LYFYGAESKCNYYDVIFLPKWRTQIWGENRFGRTQIWGENRVRSDSKGHRSAW